jgi:hypothetical protein
MSGDDRVRTIRNIFLNDRDPLVVKDYGPSEEYDS